MISKLSFGLFAGSLLLLSACGEDLPAVDCNQTIPKYSEMNNVFAKCTACHATTKEGAARAGAPSDVNYDTYAAAKAAATDGAAEINERAMPPPDGSGMPEAERQQFFLWAQCGTPE